MTTKPEQKILDAVKNMTHERENISNSAQYLMIPQTHYETILTCLTHCAEELKEVEGLRECAHCGEDASFTSDEDAYSYTVYGRPWFEVGCNNCGIKMQDKKIWDEYFRLTKECYPKDSFDRWNTRKSIEKLKEVLG